MLYFDNLDYALNLNKKILHIEQSNKSEAVRKTIDKNMTVNDFMTKAVVTLSGAGIVSLFFIYY